MGNLAKVLSGFTVIFPKRTGKLGRINIIPGQNGLFSVQDSPEGALSCTGFGSSLHRTTGVKGGGRRMVSHFQRKPGNLTDAMRGLGRKYRHGKTQKIAENENFE